ncbi:unnamed protein product [Caenorhabditis nigoni]
MSVLNFFLLLCLFCLVLPNTDFIDKFQDKNNHVKEMITSEFPLTKHDMMMLDELNSMRGLIASGEIAKAVEKIEAIIKAIGEVVAFVTGGIVKAWNEITKFVNVVTEKIKEGWDKFSVFTSNIIMNAAQSIEDAFVDLGTNIADAFSDFGNSLTNFFGRKRRRRHASGKNHSGSGINLNLHDSDMPEKFESGRPNRTLGPASDMNILTWNRRLAQLAAVSQDLFDRGQRTINYEGKEYRMFSHGGFLDYIVHNFLGKVISKLFSAAKLGYYACYLIFSGIDAPVYNKEAIKDTIFEALYANSVEVGCVVGKPNSYCIIGPIKDRIDDYFYEHGQAATYCRYGANGNLCLPPPSYFFALRDKYERRLRPRISKYEIVDGFNASSNATDEFSVEWPEEDDSTNPTFSMISIILVLLAKILF